MSERIIELLHRNLQEVFGEGDAARRRAAIDQFYTDDCVLYVPPGVFVGRDALDKFAGDLRDPPALCLHALWRSPSSSQRWNSRLGFGTERRSSRLHRAGRHHCPRRKDCCAIRFPQSKTLVALHDGPSGPRIVDGGLGHSGKPPIKLPPAIHARSRCDCDSGLHGRCAADRPMDAAKIVESEPHADSSPVALPFLAESVRESGEASRTHANAKVLALHNRCADTFGIRLPHDRDNLNWRYLRW